jgi:hypothetical protein
MDPNKSQLSGTHNIGYIISGMEVFDTLLKDKTACQELLSAIDPPKSGVCGPLMD